MSGVEAVAVDIKTIDAEGRPLVLKGVPAEREPGTGRVILNPATVARAEMSSVAGRFGLEGRDIPVLLALYAKAGYFVQGIVPELSKFNKLLFYQWKRLETLGLGEAYEHHEFGNARGGPVPIGLKGDLQRLEDSGLAKVKWSDSVTDPTVVELTARGMSLAERLWVATPEIIRSVSIDVKADLYPMASAAIRERVHDEFPEARAVYPKRARASKARS